MWSQNPGQPLPSRPTPTPSPPSRPSKVYSQREYREREMESFNTLRDVIRILTGEEPRTRQEVLRKAIDLLLSSSGFGNHSRLVNAPTASGTLAPTSQLENTALGHSSHWIQTERPGHNTGFSTEASPYDFRDDQQFHSHSTYSLDPTFDQFGPGRTSEHASNYRQFGNPF